MSKMSYIEVATAIREASKHCLEKSGSYATISGVYESVLADLIADLPSHKQVEFLKSLKTTRSYIDSVYTTPYIPSPSI